MGTYLRRSRAAGWVAGSIAVASLCGCGGRVAGDDVDRIDDAGAVDDAGATSVTPTFADAAIVDLGEAPDTPVAVSPDASPPESAPIDAAPAVDTASPPIAEANPFHPGESWVGNYFCPQGLTDLVLRVDAVDGDAIDAVFDFDFAPRDVRGSFHMKGVWSETTHRASFSPGEWIVDPSPSWYTVGMDGAVDVLRGVYSGSIVASGCVAFTVARR